MAQLQPEGRPPYVVFKKGTVEDRAASIALGRYSTKSIDWAVIRQSGSKDSVEIEANDWLDRISKNPGFAREWVDGYRKSYELWKQGQEAPLMGTPIREWGVISHEQRDMLIQLTICTVEDLAAANESALARIGMGARELKQKAQAWLETSKNVGAVVAQNAALVVENAAIRDEIEKLKKHIYANQAPNYAAGVVPNNGFPTGTATFVPPTVVTAMTGGWGAALTEQDPFA